MNDHQLSQDEAAGILSMASTKATGMTTGDFTRWTHELAQTSLAEPWLGVFPMVNQVNGHL
jgi:hypothetical protein